MHQNLQRGGTVREWLYHMIYVLDVAASSRDLGRRRSIDRLDRPANGCG